MISEIGDRESRELLRDQNIGRRLMSLLAVPDLHFRRYRQIAEVLTRHGLRWLRDASGLERFRPFRSDLSEGARAE
jgi:hypothetical protein